MSQQNQITSQLLNEPFVGADRRMNPRWYQGYFRGLSLTVNQGPTRMATVSETAQNASIVTTSIQPQNGQSLTSGTYRLTAYARVTTPAGIASDLDVTFGWTDGGVACSKSGSDVSTDWPLSGNTTDTNGSFSVMFNSSQEPASPITYSTAYVSNPATVMQYALTIVLEQVDA
jgi:hypothetical protein